ncbi:MAG: hypothetical protein HY320_11420 [Armatimonadetes bacterium]|nr:hypothetical protein [Armatimonadota bacterium]
MIVLIGVLVLACLAGAWVAFRLAQPPRDAASGTASEPSPALQPWTHVEPGPDSMFPLDQRQTGGDQASGRAL